MAKKRVEIFLSPMACSCSGETDFAEHLAFAVKGSTPSVAVDGKLERIRDCPEIADFLARFETRVRSDTS